jgi:hypothetical protein
MVTGLVGPGGEYEGFICKTIENGFYGSIPRIWVRVLFFYVLT